MGNRCGTHRRACGLAPAGEGDEAGSPPLQGGVVHFGTTIRHCDAQIKQYEKRILQNLVRAEESLQIVTSVPGVGFKIGSVILVEIGDISQFIGPKQLASWGGLAPAIYESTGKTAHVHITKRRSKYLRTALIEAAQSIAHGKPCPLKQFFLWIRARRGYNNAIVALARKVLALIHHLLTNQERYLDEL